MNGCTTSQETLKQRCLAVSLLVLDVDGVLTDGGIVLGASGFEVKHYHVRDGSGLKRWHQAGLKSAILTGRKSQSVKDRAAELGIGIVHQGAADKDTAFDQIIEESGIPAESICYVGDDWPDLGPMRRSRLAATPADACSEIRAIAHYIAKRNGGQGAVREIIELILRCQGRWER